MRQAHEFRIQGGKVAYPENPSGLVYSHFSCEGASPKAAAKALAYSVAHDVAHTGGDAVVRKHANRVVDALMRKWPEWAGEINRTYINAKREAPRRLAEARPLTGI